jgi:hypothetical protein
MLDLKTQSQLVDATAMIMRSYLRAATNAFAESAGRSMSLWSEMLEAAGPRHAPGAQPQPVARPLPPSSWPSTIDWMASSRLAAPWPAWPWLAGNGAGMSWTPLVRTWWLGPSMTFWAPLADWSVWGRAPFPAWNGRLTQAQPATPHAAANGVAQSADDSGFASYRSSGGHATTQVVMGTEPRRSNGRIEPPTRS